jgi:hypothetical protein
MDALALGVPTPIATYTAKLMTHHAHKNTTVIITAVKRNYPEAPAPEGN